MRLITETEDDALFLKRLYQSADIVTKFVNDTGILEIRKKMPDFTGSENIEEKKKMLRTQSISNMMEILKIIMEDHPDEAIELAHKFIVLEEGEDYPHGIKLFKVLAQVFTDPNVLDFFTSLQLLGATTSEG